MTDNTQNRNSAKTLRRKAEEKVAAQPVSTGEADVKHLLHELQVHQVELEMQNEDLRQANAEISGHKEHLSAWSR
jgi:hypothetical protein